MAKAKKILVALLSVVFAFSVISFLMATTVKADGEILIKDGAEVRIALDDADRNGIRFTGYVSDSIELDEDTFAGIEIVREDNAVLNIKAENYLENTQKDGYKTFTAVIYNIPETAYGEVFTAKAYLVVDGGEPTYTNEVSRSIAQVASAELVDGADPLHVETLKGYVDPVAATIEINGVAVAESYDICYGKTLTVTVSNNLAPIITLAENSKLKLENGVISVTEDCVVSEQVTIELGSTSYTFTVNVDNRLYVNGEIVAEDKTYDLKVNDTLTVSADIGTPTITTDTAMALSLENGVITASKLIEGAKVDIEHANKTYTLTVNVREVIAGFNSGVIGNYVPEGNYNVDALRESNTKYAPKIEDGALKLQVSRINNPLVAYVNFEQPLNPSKTTATGIYIRLYSQEIALGQSERNSAKHHLKLSFANAKSKINNEYIVYTETAGWNTVYIPFADFGVNGVATDITQLCFTLDNNYAWDVYNATNVNDWAHNHILVDEIGLFVEDALSVNGEVVTENKTYDLLIGDTLIIAGVYGEPVITTESTVLAVDGNIITASSFAVGETVSITYKDITYVLTINVKMAIEKFNNSSFDYIKGFDEGGLRVDTSTGTYNPAYVPVVSYTEDGADAGALKIWVSRAGGSQTVVDVNLEKSFSISSSGATGIYLRVYSQIDLDTSVYNKNTYNDLTFRLYDANGNFNGVSVVVKTETAGWNTVYVPFTSLSAGANTQNATIKFTLHKAYSQGVTDVGNQGSWAHHYVLIDEIGFYNE